VDRVEEPFDALYRHKDELFKFAMGRVRNYHDAEEIIQDTFLKAHRGQSGFRRESKEITWLREICENCCIDCWRRRRRHPECVSFDESVSKWEAVEEELSRRGAVDIEQIALDALWLRQAVAKLPENERLAFVLTRLCGYSVTQAAEEILDVPRTTLDSRLRAALGRLGDDLEPPPLQEGT
jgi:RNA polymerase sigma-70 factor (ECF subfamily)